MCFSFAMLTVVCSHFRGCASPEVGGTCGLVAPPPPPPAGVGGWCQCSWSGHTVRRRAGVQGLEEEDQREVRSQGIDTEGSPVSPDHLSQDPMLPLLCLLISVPPLTPQSWLALSPALP